MENMDNQTDQAELAKVNQQALQFAVNAAPNSPSAQRILAGQNPQVTAPSPSTTTTTPGDTTTQAPSTSGLPTITTKEEYDKLPSGAEFMQNGQKRKKP